MTHDTAAKPAPSIEAVDAKLTGGDADFQHLGITAHQHTSYEWNGYRYSNAADAIAAARRASK